MTTFSQLVDKMVAECKRPDLLVEVPSYVNQTIRELHTEPQRGNAIFFWDNLKEDQLTANLDTGYSWTVPRVSTFQGLRTVRYDSVIRRDGKPQYSKPLLPGPIMNTEDYYWYRSGSRIFFTGYGGNNGVISLAWFEFLPSLSYYPTGSRPAIYDEQAGWTYAGAYDINDATRLNAQNLVSNWMLLRWPTLMEEGLRAKIYKRLTDTERARTSFSMYTTQRQGMFSSERADFSGG